MNINTIVLIALKVTEYFKIIYAKTIIIFWNPTNERTIALKKRRESQQQVIFPGLVERKLTLH